MAARALLFFYFFSFELFRKKFDQKGRIPRPLGRGGGHFLSSVYFLYDEGFVFLMPRRFHPNMRIRKGNIRTLFERVLSSKEEIPLSDKVSQLYKSGLLVSHGAEYAITPLGMFELLKHPNQARRGRSTPVPALKELKTKSTEMTYWMNMCDELGDFLLKRKKHYFYVAKSGKTKREVNREIALVLRAYANEMSSQQIRLSNEKQSLKGPARGAVLVEMRQLRNLWTIISYAADRLDPPRGSRPFVQAPFT